MDCKCNKLYVGILVGAFLPILASYLVYAFLIKSDATYFQVIMRMNEFHLFGTLLAVSILPNLLMLFVVTKLDWLVAAKGILYSTGFYVIIAALYRFLL